MLFSWEKVRGTVANPVFHLCCQSGRVQIDLPLPLPQPLQSLLTSDTRTARLFRKNIRKYNNMLAFSSVGLQTDRAVSNERNGAYCLRVMGRVHHRIGPLLPNANQQAPVFSQIWIYDPEEQLQHRTRQFQEDTIDPITVQTLQDMLQRVNPFAAQLQTAAERMRISPDDDLAIRISGAASAQQGRQFDAPTCAEVAVILPGEMDSEQAAATRDVIYMTKAGELKSINELHSTYDPLHYVLLFPRGELGWHPRLGLDRTILPANHAPDDGDDHNAADGDEHDDGDGEPRARGSRKRLTTRMFYAYMVQKRQGQLLVNAGHLLHEYIVDNYAKVETQRLKFARQQQSRLRADLYQGAVDAVYEADGAHVLARQVGSRVILPSSFTGGPRYMQQQFQDAMGIVRALGKPDLFITFTCNPNWQEIQQSLDRGQVASDRPDLICRVFYEKVRCMMEDIKKKQIFGDVLGAVHVIEFQKRGLPHAHILAILAPRDKPLTTEDIDAITCAELPDRDTEPRLFETVLGSMIHRPCGAYGPNQPCMDGNRCSKGYPKPFASHTAIDERGFVKYRRRDNPGQAIPRRNPQHPAIDNSWVVPYNKYLSLKYNAHINVEICSSAQSVKYIYKYVYKGLDRASARLANDQEPQDEIRDWQNSRYISTTESMWRIYAFRLHQQSPTICRLDVHLPGMERVYFRDDDNIARLLDRPRATKLTAWFTLNATDPAARRLAYTDIPRHYSFNVRSRRWVARTYSRSAIGRLYFVQPRDIERYSLRLLLIHVQGATSWEHLRTVGGVLYLTFQAAATASGLLDNDQEWEDCLEEACNFQVSAGKLRELFAIVLVFSNPGSPEHLWTRFRDHFAADHIRAQERTSGPDAVDRELAYDIALHGIDEALRQVSSSLSAFGTLPTPRPLTEIAIGASAQPTNQRTRTQVYEDLASRVNQLNDNQAAIYQEIVRALASDNNNYRPQLFFIDGPGGTGKTFLYNVLIDHVFAEGHQATPVAASGIAALLLTGGRTAHSTFGLPLDMNEQSTCSIQIQSIRARSLKESKLIIWDEAPMMDRFAVEAVSRFFQDLMGSTDPMLEHVPFGGKLVIFGGDYLQTLPVIQNADQAGIVGRCLKSSPLWQHVQVRQLQQNMRVQRAVANGEDPAIIQQFADYLLRVGDGREQHVQGPAILDDDAISLPREWCTFVAREDYDRIIDHTWPSLRRHNGHHDALVYTSAAILTPLNEVTARINERAMKLMPGNSRVFNAVDTPIDAQDGNLYPPEFLNTQTPSGMPPFALELKVGQPVMLLRNLKPQQGLCNGTRLICRQLLSFIIIAEIAVGEHTGKRAVYILYFILPI